MEKDRLIDHNYYQHNETERNLWFNYSDPYFVDNEDVKEYQKEIVKKEQQLKADNNNVKVNKSENVYQSSVPNVDIQKEYVNELDNKNNISTKSELKHYQENCDNFKADTESAINFTKNKIDNNGKSFNKDNQKKKSKQFKKPTVSAFFDSNKNANHTQTTPIVEPFCDIESHFYLNNAPQYAGDNTFGSGFEHDANTFDDFAKDKHDDCDCGCQNGTKKQQSQKCDCKQSKTQCKPAQTTKDYNYYDTDFATNFSAEKDKTAEHYTDTEE